MTAPAILVIDDDAAHLDRAVPHLRLLKMAVLQAQTKEEALQALEHHDVEVVLLELGLGSEIDPDVEPAYKSVQNSIHDSVNLPALEVLEIIRSRYRYTPVIVVTYFEKSIYELMAIRTGADAYLRKPVDLNLLGAYVRGKISLGGWIRSCSEPATNGNGMDRTSILITGELLIDTRQRLLRVANGPYQSLSTKEIELLTLLARNPGKVFCRRELFEAVWGAAAGESYDAVDSVVKRIRKKIEPSLHHPRYLIAVRGLGYRLAE